MATYNLNAADLITLLSSSVQDRTSGTILQALEQVGYFPITSPVNPTPYVVSTYTGPNGGSSLPVQMETVPGGTQLALIDLPSSTHTTGGEFGAPTIGPSTPTTLFGFTTSGGVVIAAGDQAVVVKDLSSGGDTLVGGAGYERLIATSGNNVLIGGSGLNTLNGGSGSDTLIGGGQTREVAGTGANLLLGGLTKTASDTLVGGTGADTLSVTYGNNRLVAGGANSLYAGAGNDTLFGASGAYMQGGTGNARLVTGAGPETIVAGSGSDTVVANDPSGMLNVTGGIGALRVIDNGNGAGTGDSLTLQGGLGSERVLLGVTGTDSITGGSGSISAVSYQSAANLMNSSTTPGGTHTLTFTNGQVIVVNDANHNITLNFNGGGSAVV